MPDAPNQKHILISGASGFIGSHVADHATQNGYDVARMVRSKDAVKEGDVYWRPSENEIDRNALEGRDAVVHLAGESLIGRWTAEKKARIRDSRVEGTKLLCRTLAECKQPPRVLISASAVGIYGDRGDELLDESSAPGNDFLAQVGQEWEAATQPAKDAGIRVVLLRIGMVLGPDGGALGQMLLPFRLGIGGRLGSGRHYMSWIAIQDLARIIIFCIENEQIDGPVNAVSPNPVRNFEFTKTLGRVMSRPTVLPVPAFALRLIFGQLADALLLASQRVTPAKLQDLEFSFEYIDLENALRSMLH